MSTVLVEAVEGTQAKAVRPVEVIEVDVSNEHAATDFGYRSKMYIETLARSPSRQICLKGGFNPDRPCFVVAILCIAEHMCGDEKLSHDFSTTMLEPGLRPVLHNSELLCLEPYCLNYPDC